MVTPFAYDAIDSFSREVWGPVMRRGFRIDVARVMRARREQPEDFMWKQILESREPDRRVRPRLNVAGTVTGRMTMHGPNLQGLSPAYRETLLADAGMVLVGCDLSHVEPSMAAALSQDAALVEAVQPGRDPYLALASTALHREVVAGDEARGLFKTALLALLYGEGVTSLATRLYGVESPSREQLAEARGMRESVLGSYPVLAAWMSNLRSVAEAGQRLQGVAGRDVSGVGVNDRGEIASYRAVNYVVQSSAADLFKWLTLRVDRALSAAGMPGSLWLPIHDELVVMIPESRAAEARDILGTFMSCELLGVSFFGDAEVLGQRFRKTG